MALTSQETLRGWILRALLGARNYSLPRSDVLQALDAAHATSWTAEDVAPPPTRPSEKNWANRASFERADMVRDGLLTDDADGRWTLTEEGLRQARAQTWDLEPGAEMTREQRRVRFGGALYGGIEPSARTPNIFLYSDPDAGRAFGYDYDGWSADGAVFLYTGDGQRGDQQLRDGNLALLTHVESHRALRLFVANGMVQGTSTKRQLYLGQFVVDRDKPYVRADAPDEAGIRSVLVFRLRPLGQVLHREQDRSGTGDISTADQVETEAAVEVAPEVLAAAVEAESVLTDQFLTRGRAAIVAVRREAQLLKQFRDFLLNSGRQIDRYKLRPRGELRSLWTDLVDHTDGVLYEAKASAARDDIRMAVGQLLDYRRHVPGRPRLRVLVPSKPTDDLLQLLHSVGIGCTWPAGGVYEHLDPGTKQLNSQ
jgi:hypothetical protein